LQWLSKSSDTKLSNAVRSLLQKGPNATDYTMLDTLLQGLEVNDYGNHAKIPIIFLSKYHETCVVVRNAQELSKSFEEGAEHGQLDENSLELVKENLHFLESEASKRLSELLCDVSFNEQSSFWLPLLGQLESYVYRRPPVVTASDSRRILRRIEEITTSWNRDTFLPSVMPEWEQVREAIVNVFHTWINFGKVNVFTGDNKKFEIKGDQYMSLRASIAVLPSPELLGNVDWVDNIKNVITEDHLKSVYNKTRKETANNKMKNEGESGLVPRMRWALAENLAYSLGVAHRKYQKTNLEELKMKSEARSTNTTAKQSRRRPLKHQRT
jgi:hypothetical protein